MTANEVGLTSVVERITLKKRGAPFIKESARTTGVVLATQR